MCTPEAATPIKSYSPDLMVLPILSRTGANQFNKWLDKTHAMIIGPGLGRDEETMIVATEWIHLAKQKNIPIIIDVDGLHLVTDNPGLIRGYPDAILTPNVVEFERLFHTLTGKPAQKPISDRDLMTVANKLKCAVVCKGAVDKVCCKETLTACSEVGSSRRVGGQGDILAGAMGIFSFWAKNAEPRLEGTPYQTVAAAAASSVVKRANALTFTKQGRSMITSDMVATLPQAFIEVMEVPRK